MQRCSYSQCGQVRKTGLVTRDIKQPQLYKAACLSTEQQQDFQHLPLSSAHCNDLQQKKCGPMGFPFNLNNAWTVITHCIRHGSAGKWSSLCDVGGCFLRYE